MEEGEADPVRNFRGAAIYINSNHRTDPSPAHWVDQLGTGEAGFGARGATARIAPGAVIDMHELTRPLQLVIDRWVNLKAEPMTRIAQSRVNHQGQLKVA
jgi:hypothetical protein